MKRYPILWIVVLFFPLLLSAAEKNKGKVSNLVCFLRFNDEDNKEQFDKPISYYETMFNAEVEGANSVYGYFREASIISFFGKVLSSPNQTVHRSFLIKLKMSVDIIGKRIVLMI